VVQPHVGRYFEVLLHDPAGVSLYFGDRPKLRLLLRLVGVEMIGWEGRRTYLGVSSHQVAVATHWGKDQEGMTTSCL
jgi:hypothetical protein